MCVGAWCVCRCVCRSKANIGRVFRHCCVSWRNLSIDARAPQYGSIASLLGGIHCGLLSGTECLRMQWVTGGLSCPCYLNAEDLSEWSTCFYDTFPVEPPQRPQEALSGFLFLIPHLYFYRLPQHFSLVSTLNTDLMDKVDYMCMWYAQKSVHLFYFRALFCSGDRIPQCSTS